MCQSCFLLLLVLASWPRRGAGGAEALCGWKPSGALKGLAAMAVVVAAAFLDGLIG